MTFTSPLHTTWWRHLISPQWRWALFLVVGAIVILIAWLGFRRIPTTTFDLSRHSVPLDQLVDGGPGKDGMTDTDNTGESAEAYYGDIVLKRRTD